MKIINNVNIPRLIYKNTYKSNPSNAVINKSDINEEKERVDNLENITLWMAFLSVMLSTLDTADLLGKEKIKKFPLFMYATTFLLIIITAIKKFNLNNKQGG